MILEDKMTIKERRDNMINSLTLNTHLYKGFIIAKCKVFNPYGYKDEFYYSVKTAVFKDGKIDSNKFYGYCQWKGNISGRWYTCKLKNVKKNIDKYLSEGTI